MRVALCCIGKMENPYIREFVEYYERLGVDRIFLYDNNDLNGERFDSVIHDKIAEGLVKISNFRGKHVCQLEAYQDCYNSHHNEFDWMCFFDCDEFLTFKQDSNIKEYLSRDVFSERDAIHVNWLLYGDNGLLRQDSRMVQERFSEPAKLPADTAEHPNNSHIKTILRCKIPYLCWTGTPHTPSIYLSCCDEKGVAVSSLESFVRPASYELAYLKHYNTKTIEEYKRKRQRGYPDFIDYDGKLERDFDFFFTVNEWTKEKQGIINEK